MVMIGQ